MLKQARSGNRASPKDKTELFGLEVRTTLTRDDEGRNGVECGEEVEGEETAYI